MNKKLLIVSVAVVFTLVGCSKDSSGELDQSKNNTNQYEVKNEEVIKEREEMNKQSEKNEFVEKEENVVNKNENSKEDFTTNKTKKIEEKESSSIKQDVIADSEVGETIDNNDESNKEPIEPPTEEIVETPVKQTEMANQVMNQINAYRQQHGLQPLESTSYYQEKADAHALDMATQRALWHADNGECITNHPDPFNAWISSPEHNEILLRENNTQGVVSIYYVDGYYYSVFRTAW